MPPILINREYQQLQQHMSRLDDLSIPSNNDIRHHRTVRYVNSFLETLGSKERVYLIGSTGEKSKLTFSHRDHSDVDILLVSGKLEISQECLEYNKHCPCYAWIKADAVTRGLGLHLVDDKYISANALREVRPELFSFLKAIYTLLTPTFDHLPELSENQTSFAVSSKVGLAYTVYKGFKIDEDIGKKDAKGHSCTNKLEVQTSKDENKWANLKRHKHDVQSLRRLFKILQIAEHRDGRISKNSRLAFYALALSNALHRQHLREYLSPFMSTTDNKNKCDQRVNQQVYDERVHQPFRDERVHQSVHDERVNQPVHDERVHQPVRDERVHHLVCKEPVHQPVCDERVHQPVCKESVHQPVCDERVHQPVCKEPVHQPVCDERVHQPVCKEPVHQPVCDERVHQPVCKESVHQPVCDERVHQPVCKEPVHQPVCDERVHQPVCKEPVHQPVCDERVHQPVCKEPVHQPVCDERVHQPIFESINDNVIYNNHLEDDFQVKATYEGKHHLDYVPVFKIEGELDYMKLWKQRVKSNNWQQIKIEEVSSLDVFLVARMSPVNPNQLKDFSLSFNLSEGKLVKAFSRVQRYVYLILKAYLKGIFEKLYKDEHRPLKIKTYHVKTILFWLFETQMDDIKQENEARAVYQIVCKALLLFREKLTERNLPHYFVPAVNLLSEFEEQDIRIGIDCIDNVLENPLLNLEYFFKLDDGRPIDILLSPEEVACSSLMSLDNGMGAFVDSFDELIVDMHRGLNEMTRDEEGKTRIIEAVLRIMKLFLKDEKCVDTKIFQQINNVLSGVIGRRSDNGDMDAVNEKIEAAITLAQSVGMVMPKVEHFMKVFGGRPGLQYMLRGVFAGKPVDFEADLGEQILETMERLFSCSDQEEDTICAELKYKSLGYFSGRDEFIRLSS